MGVYLKTRYQGIFQYVGKNGTAYGISYRTGGKKRREIVGSLLGEAQEKLAEKKAMGNKGIVLSAYEKRKITLRNFVHRSVRILLEKHSHETSEKYFIG
jgi:hypothetical protein